MRVGADSAVRLLKTNGDGSESIQLSGLAVPSLSWGPDGQQLAIVDEALRRSSRLQLWNVDGSPGPVFGHQGSSASSVAWSRDGERLAVSDADHTITVWDAVTRLAQWKAVFVGDDRSVTFGPDGQVRDGKRGTLEKHFIYIVEFEDARLETVKPFEFENLVSSSNADARLHLRN